MLFIFSVLIAQEPVKPEIEKFSAFIWKSETPKDCPFKQSKKLNEIKFLGIKSGFHYGDTWYPSWGADDKLYSPWTDGNVNGVSSLSCGIDGTDPVIIRKATTGQAIISGDDPLSLSVEVLKLCQADPFPYAGRYPCGSLMYNGVWYYGTYCLSPSSLKNMVICIITGHFLVRLSGLGTRPITG